MSDDKLWRITTVREVGGKELTHVTWKSTDEGKDEYVNWMEMGRGKVIDVTQYQQVDKKNKVTWEKSDLEVAKSALRIIRTWAACDDMSKQSRSQAMQDIIDKCNQTLEGLNDGR